MAIEKIFPKAPSDVIYCAISLMQKWRLLLKEEDRKLFDLAKDDIMQWMKNFQPSAYSESDIVEIYGLFVWLWLIVNDRKFPVEIVFFSHTNQPAVLLHEPATI